MLKKILKKVLGPIFLSCLCGLICGKLVYQVYDSGIEKEKNRRKNIFNTGWSLLKL